MTSTEASSFVEEFSNESLFEEKNLYSSRISNLVFEITQNWRIILDF